MKQPPVKRSIEWLSVGVLGCALLAVSQATEVKDIDDQVEGTAAATGTLGGRVYCADTNQPARFATVRVQLLSSVGHSPTGGASSLSDSAMTETDLDGEFQIDHLGPGEYVVLASLPGYVYPLAQFSWSELTVDATSTAASVRQRVGDALPHVTIEGGRASSVVLRLERGAEISGSVTYDDGSPAISAHITVYRFSESNHEWQVIQQPPNALFMMSTDDRGRFRVTELPPGKYEVSASIPPTGGSSNSILGGRMRFDTGLSSPGRLEIFAGNTVRRKDAKETTLSSGESRTGVDIQIGLSHFRVLAGTVVAESDGHSLKEAAVELTFADDRSKYLVAHIGSDGRFTIPFVLDGDYILTVTAASEGESINRSYRTVSKSIDVHEDIRDLSIALPDASP